LYNINMTILRRCQDKQEWDNYILDNAGHPLQLWGWGDLKSAHGWKADRLFLLDDAEEVIGAAQLLIRKLPWPLRSLSYIPRGPVVKETNRVVLLDELASYAKTNYHSVAISVEPDCIDFEVPTGWEKSANRILPSKTIILDIKQTESELLADMVKKTRQYIRKSASEAMKIKVAHSKDELTKCLKIYHETARRAKFNLHDDQYYYDVFSKLGDKSVLFVANVDDEPAAFLWLAISADTAFELYGGMNEVGQQMRLNYALKWHAILKCKEWGLGRYDFGGLIGGGVSNFKLSWASAETELAGTFDLPLSGLYRFWSRGLPFAKNLVHKVMSVFRHR